MVLRGVQGGEIEEILFDFRAVGGGETNRRKQGFDAFQCARDRMQSATQFTPAGQADIECFFCQAGRQSSFANGFAAAVEGFFNGLFGLVDCRASSFLFFRRQLSQVLEQFADLAIFAKKAGFCLLQRVGVRNSRKGSTCLIDDLFKVVHEKSRVR